MPLQIGTVDGLINITEDKIKCFVKGINSFDDKCIKVASDAGISFGNAFQRFMEPVYNNPALTFDSKSISVPALTRSGSEQSPARVTFCKKMGLLNIDERNNIFELTELGEAILNDKITIAEYALLLLSKQGLFVDNEHKINLLTFIGRLFEIQGFINEEIIKDAATSLFGNLSIVKTRIDIILNACVEAGLIINVAKNSYVLADLIAADILKLFIEHREDIAPAIKDDNERYSEYIGSLHYGIFDILNKDNLALLDSKYPNLKNLELESSIKKFIIKDLAEAVLNSNDRIRGQFGYMRAMRTKPFLLLAGISGTGKSRIVKQMAFDSCPDNNALRSDLTSPGNYCLIEVKPNWHDSTELLGYESKIGGAHYQLTPFVKFLAKAILYPDVPFFVCLDEMNLAPVEQYFAEFLSVLESRTKIDGHIVSEPLIKASIFASSEYEKDLKHEIFDVKIKEKDANGIKIYEADLSDDENAVYEMLKENGLRIPENVIVIGTVNMDETTHQFSRKVIDRAMTIEMNLPEGDPFMDFFANASELEYRTIPTSSSLYLATETKASEVVKALAADNVEKTEWLKGEVAKLLTAINTALEGTPFKVAYRVQNELMLYFYQIWFEDKSADWETLLNTAVDQILMMKVLPRVEGDEELLEKPLDRLIDFSRPYPNALKKLAEMKQRLGQSQFTSFWP